MVRNKIQVRIVGLVSMNYSAQFVRNIYNAFQELSVGWDHINRIANAQTEGLIRGCWHLTKIKVLPEVDQHIGAYTEQERPFSVIIKTTARNEGKLENLLEQFPQPLGGYFYDFEKKYHRN